MDPARNTLKPERASRPLAYIVMSVCVANLVMLLTVWMLLNAYMEPKIRFESTGSSNESRCPAPPDFNKTQLYDACMDVLLKKFNSVSGVSPLYR